MPTKVRRFRHRNANEDLKPNDSGSPLARANVVQAPEVRRLEFINRSPRRLVEDLRVKRAGNEKECRALKLSRPRRHNEVACLPQPSADRNNHKAERESQEKKHPRKDHNSSDDYRSGSGTRSSGAVFLRYNAVVGRLCQTPGKLGTRTNAV